MSGLSCFLKHVFISFIANIMNRVDGLSFRSNPDLLQRHKTSTNNYISIYRKREGERDFKERIQKEAGK